MICWGGISSIYRTTLMHKTEKNTWELIVPYSKDDFTKTILVRFIGCFLPPGETSCLATLFARDLGQGYQVYLNENSHSELNAFPTFCLPAGTFQTFRGIKPPIGIPERSLPVYIPASILENPLPRDVNVFFLYDGDFDQSAIVKTVLDYLHLNGEIPEMIVIGIPNFGSSNLTERFFELTPTKCVPDNNCPLIGSCTGFTHSGGFPLLLQYMVDSILPTVLDKLSMTTNPRRTGSGGFSLGGLSACEAVYRTNQITKGYCGSPSLWWNCAEFVRNYNSHPPFAKLYLDAGTGELDIEQAALQAWEHLKNVDGFSDEGNLWLKIENGDFHEVWSFLTHLPNALKTLFSE